MSKKYIYFSFVLVFFFLLLFDLLNSLAKSKCCKLEALFYLSQRTKSKSSRCTVKVHSHTVMSYVWCPLGRFTCSSSISRKRSILLDEQIFQADLLFLLIFFCVYVYVSVCLPHSAHTSLLDHLKLKRITLGISLSFSFKCTE